MVGNYQSYQVPTRWRNLSFQTVLNLINKFAQKPLANLADKGKSPFVATGMSDDRNQYINWKKIFVLFSLASSNFPNDA